jgi:hypothetical protein
MFLIVVMEDFTGAKTENTGLKARVVAVSL